MKKIVLYIGLILALPSEAQEDSFYQLQYREKVLHYNQDIKAADYQVSMRTEMTQSARANFLPKLSADANFKYTGNPLQLIRTVGDMPISFEGRNIHYGGSLTLAQPIYMGGSLQAAYRKALQEKSLAEQERRHILNNIAYDADVHYWNAVAGREMVGVAAEYKKAVSRLVTVVKHRVEVEYIDKNDLLMAEVKLNEADYQWLQAINQAEVSNLALYSFAGLETNEDLSTDSIVVALKQGMTEIPDVMATLVQRPEMQIARSQVGIQESTGKIANAQYLPQISVGINGSYSSPGYDFTSDLDPNYAVYAKVSIPLYEWGKRKNTRHASRYQIQTAQENQQKIEDQVRLEIETAYYTFTQSIDQVRLTSSLKAQYQALQSQLNPHFLFNSLNALIAEIEYSPEKAIEFTRYLSDVYRYILQSQERQMVPLREELEFLHSFIFLHKVRLGECITVENRIKPSLLDSCIPPLTLQLLVENIIKHNIISLSKPMNILLDTEDSPLRLVVKNQIRSKQGIVPSGKGLMNLAKRYRLLCNQEIQITKDSTCFIVKVPLLDE